MICCGDFEREESDDKEEMSFLESLSKAVIGQLPIRWSDSWLKQRNTLKPKYKNSTVNVFSFKKIIGKHM